MAESKKQQRKDRKKQKDGKKPTDEADEPMNRRPLWTALAVLALLAVLLWYLNRQGYLQRWLPAGMGYSPSSAPPYEGF